MYGTGGKTEWIAAILRSGFINLQALKSKVASFDPFQIELMHKFAERGEGAGKLTFAQVFTTDRYGRPSEFRFPTEKAAIQDMQDDGYIDRQKGATTGHDRFTLTPLGQLLMAYVTNMGKMESMSEDYKPFEPDWSRSSDDIYEQDIEPFDFESGERPIPPAHILARLHEYHARNKGDRLTEAWERAIEVHDDCADYGPDEPHYKREDWLSAQSLEGQEKNDVAD